MKRTRAGNSYQSSLFLCESTRPESKNPLPVIVKCRKHLIRPHHFGPAVFVAPIAREGIEPSTTQFELERSTRLSYRAMGGPKRLTWAIQGKETNPALGPSVHRCRGEDSNLRPSRLNAMLYPLSYPYAWNVRGTIIQKPFIIVKY